MICIKWHVQPTSILLTKGDGSTLIINIGQFIEFEGREMGLRVESFKGTHIEGPIGMEYLPWRSDRWATPMFGIRGNPRFIICPPIGIQHYGQHIDWNTVKLLNEGICPL